MSEVTSVDQLLSQMVELKASDLHLTVGAPPVVRLRGHLQRFEGVPAMSAENTRDLLYRILSSEQQKQFELQRQLDFAYSMPGLARFRVHVYYQREPVRAAFRRIPHAITQPELLSPPPMLHSPATYPTAPRRGAQARSRRARRAGGALRGWSGLPRSCRSGPATGRARAAGEMSGKSSPTSAS